MKLYSILAKIKSLVKFNRVPNGAVHLISIGFLLVLIPFNVSAPQKATETRIQFNQNDPVNIVDVADKKVVVETGGSREDLNSYNPEAFKGLMKQYSLQYGIDWKLVYAIGYHESGNFTSSLARRQNNFFGRKASSGGYASWVTPEDAIRNQFEYLKTRYFDIGLDTPEKINHVYAEDSSWSFAVRSVMNSL